MSHNNIDPILDGTTHIRIGASGKTRLGRLLGNGFPRPLVIEGVGTFRSMQNYWWWVSNGSTNRKIIAAKATHLSRLAPTLSQWSYGPTYSFRVRILEGLKAKLEQTPDLFELFMETKASQQKKDLEAPLTFCRYLVERDEDGHHEIFDLGPSWFLEALTEELTYAYVTASKLRWERTLGEIERFQVAEVNEAHEPSVS